MKLKICVFHKNGYSPLMLQTCSLRASLPWKRCKKWVNHRDSMTAFLLRDCRTTRRAAQQLTAYLQSYEMSLSSWQTCQGRTWGSVCSSNNRTKRRAEQVQLLNFKTHKMSSWELKCLLQMNLKGCCFILFSTAVRSIELVHDTAGRYLHVAGGRLIEMSLKAFGLL